MESVDVHASVPPAATAAAPAAPVVAAGGTIADGVPAAGEPARVDGIPSRARADDTLGPSIGGRARLYEPGPIRRPPDPPRRPNILVISDLHLGEDVKPHLEHRADHMRYLERALEGFLQHYTRTRLDGRPWRLIVNGDMIDFLSVCLLPGEAVPGEKEPHSPEEHRFGLGSGPRSARKKILRVLQRHPVVFRRLAEFVRAGNDLVIVLGNHDVELHWRVVQEAFRERLAVLALGKDAESGGAAAEAFKERVTFTPWFHYEEGVVYVEHGHQYDEYCSFDYQLSPIAPRAHEGILLSLGAASIRFLVNNIPNTDAFVLEEWSMLGLLQWAIGQGLRTALQILYLYAFTVWKLMAVWGQLRDLAADRRRRHMHEDRMAELAVTHGLPIDTLRRVDALHRRPVLKSFWKLFLALFLDRVALATLAIVGVVLAIAEGHGWWRVVDALACVGGAGVTAELLARLRQRDTDSDSRLREMPVRLLEHVKAPYLVFGHSHTARAIPLPGGATYFNTGTWVAGQKPGLLSAFTHVLLRRERDDRVRGTLCQWREGASRAFTPLPASL